MSVVIETTLGDITVDLYLEQRPVTCLNFIKLCKMKYYNFNLFHSIRSGFIAQTGDPTGTGSGGQSIFGILGGPQKRFFSGEKMPKIRHTDTGLLSMVCTDDMMVGSQFFFTLAPDLDSLDGVHCVIGEVTEGHEVLRKLNDVICDDTHRPYRDVRITHTVILEDPFNDPAGFKAPSRSPSPSAERLSGGRIAPDEEIDETKGKSVAEVHEMLEEKEAKARATILEIIGDLPDADIAPPENVLFVCKLNPVTTDEDLEIIFSRFGKIVTCEVIRDKKSGDSLQYAFIEFADKKSCEDAYFKMDNVLIDDRRIHVDFSQSVSKIRWLGKGRGVKHISDEDLKISNHTHNNHPNQLRNNEKNYKNGNDYDSKRENNKDRKKYDDRRNRDSEKHHNKHERSKRTTHNRDRSRSKSKRDKPREEPKDDKYNSHTNTHHSEKKYERKYNFNKEDSVRRKEDSRQLSSKEKYSESKHVKNIEKSGHLLEENNKKNNEQKQYNDKRKAHRSDRDLENKKGHLKYSTEERFHKHNEKQKSIYVSVEPRTPSPILDKKASNDNEIKKSRESKKKRKPSTSSSDSDSSESSSTSSSQSTSSGERDKKKKVLKIRKRKYSSSSSSSSTSSSDSSSSSTTSSSSSSSSTSSDCNTNKRKRRKKNVNKKETSKPKNKT